MLSRNRFSQKNIDEDGNWWNLWCPVLKLCAEEIELHKNLAGLHSIFPKNLSADDLVLSQSVWILLYHLRASSHFPFMHMRGAGWAYRARYAITHSALVKPLIPAFRRWAILAFCGFLPAARYGSDKFRRIKRRNVNFNKNKIPGTSSAEKAIDPWKQLHFHSHLWVGEEVHDNRQPVLHKI